MAAVFDIKLFGDKELARALGRLADVLQKKIVKKAFRSSLERVKNKVLLNMSGGAVEERTGAMVNAFERINPRVRVEKDGSLVVSMKLPTRAQIGIEADAKGYYPAALEYGVKRGPHQFAAKRMIRDAVNRVQEQELRRIGTAIGNGIAREAAKRT